MKCAVIVFGDLGRSPRMQNHALEITKQTNYYVYLCGYLENLPQERILQNKKIQLVDMSSILINYMKKLPSFLYIFYAIFRIILQIFLKILNLQQSRQNYFKQNPPSIPGLSVLWILSKILRFKLIIDFHNYGYTILQLNVKNRFLIKLCKQYEWFFGKQCQGSFCVSKAMQKDLKDNWGIQSQVLYDKCTQQVQMTQIEKQQLKTKLNVNQDEILLVSSTSWTKDEDFQIILDALQIYDKNQNLPKICLIITGKGPEKNRYLQIISKMSLQKIRIITHWLTAEDYPRLLASADLGICLHYSSSGLDLPMKVVDMFTQNLPVFAIQYQCIDELVQDNSNGQIFNDKNDLANKLMNLFQNDYQEILNKYRINLLKFKEQTWEKEWRENALSLID